MPVILKIEQKNGQKSGIWEIREDEPILLVRASLNDSDRVSLSNIINPQRRLEWLAVRALLKEFYTSPPTIQYDAKGKPHFTNQTDKISISHSGKMVAIALYFGQTPGIDIEKLHPRIRKIATRFLSDEEKITLGTNPSIEQLTIVWGAKEVLFKVYEHGGIEFKTDFRIQPFVLEAKGKLKGIIQKGNNTLRIPMEYLLIDDYVLVQTDYSHLDFKKNS